MLETFYVSAGVALLGLFAWGPVHRRFLSTRPRAALVTRYVFVASGAYTASLLGGAIVWGLVRDHLMPEASPYIWDSLPAASIYIGIAIAVGLMTLPPQRARAIEAAMTNEPSPPPEEVRQPHWTDGLTLTDRIATIAISIIKAIVSLGWLTLIVGLSLVGLFVAYLAFQGIEDISTPQAVILGAAIIAWAIFSSNRK